LRDYLFDQSPTMLVENRQAQLELEYKPISWLSMRLGEQHNQNPMMGEPEGYLTYLSLYIRR